MNTFEKHYQDFPKFIEKIMSWPPDYVVPVAKKGCKLLKASNAFNTTQQNQIKYRSYFLLNQLSVKNKKIAIIDDATQFTATLLEYRRFFENMGAIVRTFSFVGNEKLFDGKRRMYDEETEIEKFLPEPVYQEYILQQSYYLLDYGNHFDLDHLIFEIPLPTDKFEQFLAELRQRGVLLFLEDYFLQKKIRRFSLNEFTFFNSLPYFSHESVNLGSIKKLKFAYSEEDQKLFFSPLVFPTWDFHQSNLNGSLFQGLPFTLPFKMPNHIDKKNKGVLLQIYNNIYFTYVASLAKAFVQELQSFYDVSNKLDVKRNDLDATLGKQETDKLLNSVKGFLTTLVFMISRLKSLPLPLEHLSPNLLILPELLMT